MGVVVLRDDFPGSLDVAWKTVENAHSLFTALLPVETPDGFLDGLKDDVTAMVENRLDEDGHGNPPDFVDIYDLVLNRLYPYFANALIKAGEDAQIIRETGVNDDGQDFVEYTIDISFESDLPPLEGIGDDSSQFGVIAPPAPGVSPPSIPANPFPLPTGAPPSGDVPGLPPSQQPSKQPGTTKKPIGGGVDGTGGTGGTGGSGIPITNPTRPPDDPPTDDPPEGGEDDVDNPITPIGDDDDDDDDDNNDESLLRQILEEIRRQNEANREQERRLFAEQTSTIDRINAGIVVLQDLLIADIGNVVQHIDNLLGEDLVDGLLGVAESLSGIDDLLEDIRDSFQGDVDNVDFVDDALKIAGFTNLLDYFALLDEGLGKIETAILKSLGSHEVTTERALMAGVDAIGEATKQASEKIDSLFEFDADQITASMCDLIAFWKKLMNTCNVAGGKEL